MNQRKKNQTHKKTCKCISESYDRRTCIIYSKLEVSEKKCKGSKFRKEDSSFTYNYVYLLKLLCKHARNLG